MREQLRILDLSMGWAGPLVSYVLACFGAEVIKVEDTRHFDWWRGTHPKDAPRGPDGSIIPTHEMAHVFNSVNRGKRGITLDLARPEGRDILLRLAAVSDVLVENYTPRVMAQFGLEYAILAEVNPFLIMLSMPAFGTGGPESGYVAFGMTIEAMAGLTSLCGYEDGPPQMMTNAFGDPVSGLNGAVAVLLAALERRANGRGCHVELAQLEGFLPMVAGALLDAQMNDRARPRAGNRHSSIAPHGAYRCAREGLEDGADPWIAIAAPTDRDWQALCAVISRPELACDQRFADVVSRTRHARQIDALLAAWTAERSRDEALSALCAAGVAAAAVRSNDEVPLERAHLARGLFQPLERAHVGLHLYPGLPILADDDRPAADTAAPCLGEHNAEVMGGLLGLPPAAIDEMERSGVVGSTPRE